MFRSPLVSDNAFQRTTYVASAGRSEAATGQILGFGWLKGVHGSMISATMPRPDVDRMLLARLVRWP